MEHQFEGFIDDIRSTHGKNLAGVILYGSAAAGDFIPKHSDYNILIALHKITPNDLREANACIREWHRMGHPIPVYFTVSELQNAADVFPIEFHQMSIARKVLYGTDLVADLKISSGSLRHQTEYELCSKLIQLRRQYIPASASAEGLVKLMSESLSSFAALFRAVLLLNSEAPPVKKLEIINMTVKKLGLDQPTFERIFGLREIDKKEKPTAKQLNELFGDYMVQIEKVINFVDAIDRS